MEHFAGLDVATATTAVCIVDGSGASILEQSGPTDPAQIAQILAPYGQTLIRVGHEAGSLSPWLHRELEALGVPIHCLETRHVRAAMAAQRNKTDKNDALALAQIMRTGWFRAVHIKSETAYRLRLLLTQRRNLKRKFVDLENSIRHSLKAFGIRLSPVSRGRFEAKVRELIGADPLLVGMIEPMLTVRAVMWEQYGKLHSFLLKIVAGDEVCRRFMSVPGVGPVTALAVKSALDNPSRFNRSRTVGAYFGLTPRRWQSGSSIDLQGHISKQGDNDVRRYLYEAAHILLTRVQGFSTLKAWGLKLARTKGHARAVTAVARKLAMILFAMWRDGSEYRWGADPVAKAARSRRKKPALEAVIG
jgi:transposase